MGFDECRSYVSQPSLPSGLHSTSLAEEALSARENELKTCTNAKNYEDIFCPVSSRPNHSRGGWCSGALSFSHFCLN